eukprot:gene10302-7204_t
MGVETPHCSFHTLIDNKNPKKKINMPNKPSPPYAIDDLSVRSHLVGETHMLSNLSLSLFLFPLIFVVLLALPVSLFNLFYHIPPPPFPCSFKTTTEEEGRKSYLPSCVLPLFFFLFFPLFFLVWNSNREETEEE